MQLFRAALLTVLLTLTLTASAKAKDAIDEPTQDGHRLIGLLDYISADYPGAVQDGKITDQFEYDEQKELLSQAFTILARHPDAPAALLSAIAALRDDIDAIAAPQTVRDHAQAARAATLAHFKLVMAPARAPALASGRALYAANCATCHGDAGAGDGPASAALTPKPANFTDPAARDNLSPYRAFNTTTFGVEGTSMRAFTELSDAQRWDLAFYVMALGHGGAQETGGPAPAWATLDTLASSTDAQLRAAYKLDAAALASARTSAPFALALAKETPMQIVRARLSAAQQAIQRGDLIQAGLEAVSAYLDGFEHVEGQLSAIDPGLTRQIEQDFMTLRAQLKAGDKAAALATLGKLKTMTTHAEELLSTEQSAGSIALASGLILLREGIEIVLLLALLLGMTTRAGRPEGKRAIHAGWIGALIAGVFTWLAASKLIAVSGAQREIVEGVVALLASVMLFSISYWFLANLHGERWAAFLKQTAGEQIAGGRFLALAMLAFLATYREIFEMVLFYQSLLLDSPGALGAILGGAAAGGTLLALVAYSILKLGKKLPLTPFFRVSGLMLYALSVVMLGKGLHALTESGIAPLWQLALVPSIPTLGIFPEALSLGAQGALLTAGLIWAIAQRQRIAAA
jgi:high-affinity iron transporter